MNRQQSERALTEKVIRVELQRLRRLCRSATAVMQSIQYRKRDDLPRAL